MHESQMVGVSSSGNPVLASAPKASLATLSVLVPQERIVDGDTLGIPIRFDPLIGNFDLA